MERDGDDEARVYDLGALGKQVADRLIERGAFLPVLLTVEQVARFLQVKARAVRKMIYERKVPAVKTGRSWMIPRDAWLRHVERQAMRQLPDDAFDEGD